MPKVLAATPQTIAAIRKMSHIPVVMNSRGLQRVTAGGGGGNTGYSGYFKAINASTKSGETTTLKVKVVDGTNYEAETCGRATFNNAQFEVATQELTPTSSGFLFLKSTMGVEDPPLPLAPEFEYVTSWPSASDGVGRRLIATIAVDGTKMTITQQQHGEVQAFIWGACEDE